MNELDSASSEARETFNVAGLRDFYENEGDEDVLALLDVVEAAEWLTLVDRVTRGKASHKPGGAWTHLAKALARFEFPEPRDV